MAKVTVFQRYWAAGLWLAAVLSGCATQNTGSVMETQVIPTASLEGEEAAVPAPEAEQSQEPKIETLADIVFPEYQIGAGDVLQFRSYDDSTLDQPVTVRHDGNISLPWIPDVNVLGKTREEAIQSLKEAYSELYVDAEVTLTITEARSRFYTVMGDVERPAQYPYTRPMTLLDAINQAGGLRINRQSGDSFVGAQGQLVKAILIRTEDGERLAEDYDLRDLEKSGAHASQTPILPNDLIYIPEGINLVYLLGEGLRPQVYAMRQGMTLIQLLASTGGFNESVSRMEHVVVMREVEEGESEIVLVDLKTMLRTGEQFEIKPGDIVYMPRKRLVKLSDFIARVTAPLTQTIGVTQQVFGLYSSAYDTYYTKERFNRLFGDQGATTDPLSLLQSVRDLNDFAGSLQTITNTP